jgi:hypothetical protein
MGYVGLIRRRGPYCAKIEFIAVGRTVFFVWDARDTKQTVVVHSTTSSLTLKQIEKAMEVKYGKGESGERS